MSEYVIQLRGGPCDGMEARFDFRPDPGSHLNIERAIYRESDTLLLSGTLGESGGPPEIAGAVYDFAGYERGSPA